MDDLRKIEIISEATEVYSRGGLPKLEDWANAYSGQNGDAEFAKDLYRGLERCSLGNDGRCWSLSCFGIVELLNPDKLRPRIYPQNTLVGGVA